MADEGDKIPVKTLKNTDLKAEDISKAIDATAAKSVTPKPKEVKVTKPAPSKTKSAGKPEAKDNGTPIVVKKHGTYVGGTEPSPPPAKPAEPAKEEENKVELKAPSELGKTVTSPISDSSSTQPVSSNEPAVQQKPDASSQPAPTKDSEPATETSSSTTTPTTEPKPAKVETVPAQQALKTFDTNEYHLPIKPTAGNHYMNRGLSWAILLIVLFGVGGYVLITLEVINPTDFGF